MVDCTNCNTHITMIAIKLWTDLTEDSRLCLNSTQLSDWTAYIYIEFNYITQLHLLSCSPTYFRSSAYSNLIPPTKGHAHRCTCNWSTVLYHIMSYSTALLAAVHTWTPQSTHVLAAKATLKNKPDNNNNCIRIWASRVIYCQIKTIMEEQGEHRWQQ
jgi:hypothetical protein